MTHGTESSRDPGVETAAPLGAQPLTPLTPSEAAGVYRAIFERCNMRHLAGGEVDERTRSRVLLAAHHAPSVGYMRPWRFIRVRDGEIRRRLHSLVEQERLRTAHALGERSQAFLRIKVQDILDAAEVWVVALANGREAHVFGRRTMPFMDMASVACAIQNLWLAARTEGLGLGWGSIFEPSDVARCLGLPADALPVAILGLGPVHGSYDLPLLEQAGWASRLPL